MRYRPDKRALGPDDKKSLSDLDQTTGPSNSIFICTDDDLENRPRKLGDKGETLTFRDCEIKLTISKATVQGCHFKRCQISGHLTDVKFRDCTFERCHFFHARFEDCTFLDSCRFSENSVGLPHFWLKNTTISPTNFLDALATNLKHLPDGKTAEYQTYRLKKTRQELGRLVYLSTQSTAQYDIIHDAHKQLILTALKWKADRSLYRDEDEKQRDTRWRVHAFRAVGHAELLIAQASGWLTNWGRSLTRALVFFLVCVLVFSGLYVLFNRWIAGAEVSSGLLYAGGAKALDVTLVAGYSAHVGTDVPVPIQLLTVLNLLFGLYWYSLIVPVVARRVIR